MPLLNL